MSPFPRIHWLSVSAAGVLVALTAMSIPVRADELAQNLGPVGAYEPILAPVGHRRVVAFFVPEGGGCAVDAVVWNNTNQRYLIANFWPHTADLAERIRINLVPGQTVQIDDDEGARLDLRCDDKAAALRAVLATWIAASASSAP
jgi:hypothetical protein